MGQYAYDALVVEQLEGGATLESALSIAGTAYPEEELTPKTEEQWEGVTAHYGMLSDSDFKVRDSEE